MGLEDCYITNDHDWKGGGICVHCGTRLTCMCGQFIRADKMDAHLYPDTGDCPFIASLNIGDNDER